MKTSDFSFELPDGLIAQHPTGQRGASRLMVIDRAARRWSHASVSDLPRYLPPRSVVVVNDSRVRRARVYADDPERGATFELLLVRRVASNRWLVLARNARRLRPGRSLVLRDGSRCTVTAERQPYREVAFDRSIDDGWLERHGHVPLPPYVSRADEPADAERYQTVYARMVGSLAAPTAGLHLTDDLLRELRDNGVAVETVTLHVGIGTFMPVRSEHLEHHDMHEEDFHVSPATADRIAAAKANSRPVVAVGTTVVRTLESAWDEKKQRVRAGHQSTSLFIYPGYRFSVIDHLFTNFHTPESTLLALVSAFADRELILDAYREAVKQRYRFFSYGDATLIL